MIRNKKGFIFTSAIAIAIIILIIGLFTGFAFLFSNSMRWILIGTGVIIAGIYLAGQGMSSNNFSKNKIIIVLIFMLVGILLIFGSNVLQSTLTDKVVYKPRWGSLGCIEDDAPSKVVKILEPTLAALYFKTIPFEEIKCDDSDGVTDDCAFYIKTEDKSSWYADPRVEWKVCDFGGNNCLSKHAINAEPEQYKFIVKIDNGKSLLIRNTNGKYKVFVEKVIHPYRLWTEEGGGHWLTRSSDCCLVNQAEIKEAQVKYGEWGCLDKSGSNKYINYVIDWVPTSGKIYNYQGRDVICGNNVLYEVEKERMSTYQEYYIQGDVIKGVQCCPHQTANCDSSTFEFLPEEEKEERECTYDYQCENGGNAWAVTDTEAKREICEDGQCVEETFTIECGSDAKCRELYGNSYVCDLSVSNFGKCIQSGLIPQDYCGDGICQTGETSITCPVDCTTIHKEECKWYETAYEKQVEDCGMLNWKKIVPFVDCSYHTERGCRTADWVYIAVGSIIILILGGLIIFLMIPKNKSKKTKRKYKK